MASAQRGDHVVVALLREDGLEAELGDSLRRGLLQLEGDRELARNFETLFAFEAGSGVMRRTLPEVAGSA